jgi:molybdopterin-guanine dinucleotide biosynthesis protein A
MLKKENITGILLAGGQSSRMGSDKALMDLQGESFVSLITKVMAPFVCEIVIVSDHDAHDRFGFKRIEDIIKDSGPLSGIHAGLTYSETQYNLILCCDVPLMDEAVLSFLIEGFDADYDIIQLQYLDKPIPLIGIYNKSCAQVCERLLHSNERRVMKLLAASTCKTLKLTPELGVYIENINTPEQLKRIKHASDC